MAFKRTLESKELLHGVDVFDLRGHDFHEFGSGSRVSNLCSKNFLYESHTASFQIGRYSLPQSFRYSDNKVMTSGLAPKGQFLGYLLPGMTYDSIVLCFLITVKISGASRRPLDCRVGRIVSHSHHRELLHRTQSAIAGSYSPEFWRRWSSVRRNPSAV
jgi:hypothetical protein